MLIDGLGQPMMSDKPVDVIFQNHESDTTLVTAQVVDDSSSPAPGTFWAPVSRYISWYTSLRNN